MSNLSRPARCFVDGLCVHLQMLRFGSIHWRSVTTTSHRITQGYCQRAQGGQEHKSISSGDEESAAQRGKVASEQGGLGQESLPVFFSQFHDLPSEKYLDSYI